MEEDEFKDTEIGRIPKEWEVLELGDEKITVFIKSGNTPSKEIQEYWNGDILFVTQRDMTKVSKYLYETSEKITELGLKNFNLFIIPENSILLSMYGTIGKVVINKNPVTVSQNIAAIKLNNKNVNQEYFFYAIRYYSFQFKKKAKTSTMNHLNIKIVKQIYLPLPSLQEQQKIALVLSKIENAIKIQDRIINSLQELKKSMMSKLFTEGIGHTEFKDTEIGRIPKEWDIFKLEDIAMVFSGNTAPQEEKYFKNGKYPFIRVRHLTKLENYKYPLKYDLINDEAVTVLKLRKFKRGSIIFPKSGESIKLEKRAILKEDSYIVNHLAVIEPTKKINNLFLFYYLNTVKTNNYLVGTSMPSLQLSIIKKFLIPIPSLDEQNRIAYILSAIDNIISIEEDRKKYFEALFKTMLNKLMTGQIRVKNLEMRE